MKKHLGLKAFLLIVVMFFHSFVLVPKATSGSMGVLVDIAVARQALRTIAPSVLKATPAGRGYAIAYMGVAAVAYLFIKSGGVAAINNWFDGVLYPPPSSYTVGSDYAYIGKNGTTYYASSMLYSGNNYHGILKNSSHVNMTYVYQATGTYCQAAGATYTTTPGTYWCGVDQAVLAVTGYINANFSGSANPHWYGTGTPPTVPTDYGTQLATSQPSYPNNSVYFTPGGAGMLNGANTPVSYSEMSDADIDKMVSGMGLTQVDSSGNQPRPNLGDNTVSADANASIPYLQQIMNYVSNLLGIKTDTGLMKADLDNLVAGQAAQTSSLGKLDNIAALSLAQKNSLDNVALAINQQTALDNAMVGKLDNVAQGVGDLNKVAATESTISSRVDALRTLMSTKFPFSYIAGITAPTGGGGGHYDIPDLQFTGGYTLVVDPMKIPQFASFFGIVRSLEVIGMWAVFALVMIRRVTQI